MIHKINLLFIIFNTILLFIFFKNWDKMNNTKELYTTKYTVTDGFCGGCDNILEMMNTDGIATCIDVCSKDPKCLALTTGARYWGDKLCRLHYSDKTTKITSDFKKQFGPNTTSYGFKDSTTLNCTKISTNQSKDNPDTKCYNFNKPPPATPEPTSVTTISGGEDSNTNCIYNMGVLCNYDAAEPTQNRTECLNKCKLNTNCTSKDCYYRCFDETCSTWTGPNICNFIPYGATLSKCTSTCIENDGCNYSSCYNICSNCDSEKDCLWYKKKINEEEIFIKENIPVNIDPTRPLPPTIFVTVKKDGVVTVKFNPPFSINNTTPTTIETPTTTTPTSEMPTTTTKSTTETPKINTGLINTTIDTTINSFMYVVYKTQDKTGGIRIGTYYIKNDDSIRDKITKYNSGEDKGKMLPIIEFDIENLDKDTFYNIGIRSYRDSDGKISPLSNIFTVIPNKEKKHSVPRLTHDDKEGNNTSNLSVNYTPHVCSPEGT